MGVHVLLVQWKLNVYVHAVWHLELSFFVKERSANAVWWRDKREGNPFQDNIYVQNICERISQCVMTENAKIAETVRKAQAQWR